jgi:hypothetical protein
MNVSRLVVTAILVYIFVVALAAMLLGVDDYREWAGEHEGWSALVAAPPFVLALGVDLLSNRRRRRVVESKPRTPGGRP